MKEKILPLISFFLLASSHASNINELRQITECVCPGYNITYECSIDGDGFTLWTGSGFDCIESTNEIFLAHSMFMEGDQGRCNGGNIIAQSVPTNSTSFVSRLTIMDFNLALNGTTVNCSHNNGISSNIGTKVIRISDSFPPPDDVRLALISQAQLTFNWSTPAFNCHGLSYHVLLDCGGCDNASLTGTTCYFRNTSTNDVKCNFAVATIVCDRIVGNLSDPLNFTLRVLKAPNITSVNLTFNGVRGILTAINVTFTQLDFFNITNRIDGSALYHLAKYDYSASAPLTQCISNSSKIPASACMDVFCNALFDHPPLCLSNSTVTIASVNRVGQGLARNITVGSSKNSYLDVSYDQEATTITCVFLGELQNNNIKLCHIEYGPCEQQATVHSKEAENYTTKLSPNTAIIQLSSDILGYCFTATTWNNSFSVQLIDGVIVGTKMNFTYSKQRVIAVGTVLGVSNIIWIILLISFGGVVCFKQIRKKIQTKSEIAYHDRELKEFVNSCNKQHDYEPIGRFDHFMAGYNRKCYMFGGQTKSDARTKNCLSRTIQVYDDKSQNKWTAKSTTGKQPDALYEGACCTSSSGDIYYYGGRYNSVFSGALFKLSTDRYEWTQLKEEPDLSQSNSNAAPMKKMACGIVHVCLTGDKEYLIVFGGYGEPHISGQKNWNYVKLADRVWSNEIHVFDIENGEWSIPTFFGEQPPACSHFSFTGIDKSRALLFGGGVTTKEAYKHIYMFDAKTWHITAEQPLDDGIPKPSGRLSHAACCLGYGNDDEKLGLFVHGGIDENKKTLGDAWIFYVRSRRWSKLELPNNVMQRCGHSATAIEISPTCVNVVIFGGCSDYQSLREDDLHRIAQTFVLKLEYDEQDGMAEWNVAE